MRRITDYGPSIVVLATAALVLGLGPLAVRELTFHRTRAQVIQAQATLEATSILEELNGAYRAIAELVEPSVVHISASQPVPGTGRSAISTGSGWIYDDLGHVVTNSHVIADTDRIDVQLSSGEIRPAEIVGHDPSTDVAVLRIDPARIHPAPRAVSAREVRQGDLVFAFGSPFDFRFSMSSGIVSGKGRHVGVIRDRVGNRGYENFIQVDAAINPGNSGGPLTDHRGRVIGMNTAIATGGGRGGLDEGQFAGIGLAIPLEMIEPVVEQIIEKGFVEKGFLGIEVLELTAYDRRRLGFNGEGALVGVVQPGTPAALAGLQSDDVVVALDEEPMTSGNQLRSAIASLVPGQTIELAVLRWNEAEQAIETLALPVTLARLDSLSMRGELPPDHPLDHLRELGIERLTTSTPEAAAALGIPHREGVLIEATVPGAALGRDVAPGSIIVSVGDRPISSAEDLFVQLRRFDLRARRGAFGGIGGGVPVQLFAPDGRQRTVHLRYRD